jgi:2-methylcitrate dehydratase PrpD
MSKPLHAGHAADAGTLAAMLAEKGFTGALDVLEGSAGFGAALGGKPDWAKATDGLGARYNITAMTSKNHGCCGHAFAAIDGALALRDRHGLAPDRIRQIRVGTYRTAVEVTGKPEPPRTAFEGKFSLRYVVATALVRGSVRLDAFGPERLADPAVRDLMGRIALEIDPELDAQFPNRRAAIVEIETVEGERLRHLQPTRKGDPEAPLSDAELEAKFLELATPVVGARRAASLRDEIARLDRAPRTGLA